MLNNELASGDGRQIYTVNLNPGMINELKDYGKKNVPEECCGMITKQEETVKFHPIENVSKSESKWDYVMHPQQYFDILSKTSIIDKNSDTELLALFHTHPGKFSRAIPSSYDVKGAVWKVPYIIYAVSVDEMLSWYWDGNNFIHMKLNTFYLEDVLGYKLNIGRAGKEWKPW